MAEIPKTLEAAIVQAKEATRSALDAGYTRLQVELAFPELKSMPVAQQFLSLFDDLGEHLKVLFSDAGAAALARRDWGDVPFQIRGLGELKAEVLPEDRLFLLVAPSSVEVLQVEKLCEEVGDRPVILLNPHLEDVGTVGIGYAGRQLRARFLSTFESCYYLRPLDQAALLRCYPDSWQVWAETEPEYQLLAEFPQKPSGEDLDRLFSQNTGEQTAAPRKKEGLFGGLQRFLKALSN